MRTIIQVGSLIVSAAGVVFLLSLAAHSSGSPLPNGSHKDADARALFAKNCATCHGNDGQAKTFKAKLNHARNHFLHNSLTVIYRKQLVADFRLRILS